MLPQNMLPLKKSMNKIAIEVRKQQYLSQTHKKPVKASLNR